MGLGIRLGLYYQYFTLGGGIEALLPQYCNSLFEIYKHFC